MVDISREEQLSKQAGTSSVKERKYQRASCRFATVIHHHGQDIPAQMNTVGLGGCYLTTPFSPMMGEKLDLDIFFDPDKPPLPCIARVVWNREQIPPELKKKYPKGFAVEFFRMDPEHKELIDMYVRRMVRVIRNLVHELESEKPDIARIKSQFHEICPKESTHLSHIRKVINEEMKHFRLRK
jgi:hypothetical protein